jgi:pimeloyl-ACP methyl ester carboxylesterase
MTPEPEAGYVDIGGMRVWHEVSGVGEPLVLLHGGFAAASSFAAQTPAFAAAGFRVHVPERRGHGHTPDVDGPFSYAAMADDTVAYLEQVVGGPAQLVGWSDGAVIALLVALRRPDLVRRQVLIGQYYDFSGRVPGSPLDAFLATPEAIGFLRQGYDPISPDGPEHFEVVHAKLMAMFEREPQLDLAELAAVSAPTLVVQGDRDEVTVEHSLSVVGALPDARLAVLPGTHALPIESPDVLNRLLISFLRGDTPQPLWGAAD